MSLADFSFSIRMMRKNPGFTAAVALTLALGIGANAGMFSVVDSVLLKPLPFQDSERIVIVWEKPPNGQRNSVSAANFLDWREQNGVFRNLVGTAQSSFNISGKDTPERVDGMRVSWDFFEMLQVQPALGRAFVATDDRPGAEKVVVISSSLWQRRFGADPAIAGRPITVDGEKAVVAGVLPRTFRFVGAPDMFAPLSLDRAKVTRDFHYMIPLARIKDGVTMAQARAEMDRIGKNIERDYPKSNKGWGVYIQPFHEALVSSQQRAVWVLFGVVGFVLLIACVNVANLLLAKAAARQRELAVRASLGARRLTLVRQLLTESVVLAVVGGVLGLALALWLVRVLRALVPPVFLSAFSEIGLNWRVFAFTFALSVVTGLVFGVFPAWRVSNFNLHDILKEGGRGSGAGAGQSLFRNILVTAEIALSLILLVCAGLMVRSLSAMQSADPGFRPDHVLTMRLAMPDDRYPDAAAVRQFYGRVLERSLAIPGVKAAGLSMALPLQGSYFGMPFLIAGRPAVPISQAQGAPFEMATPGYFRTHGIALRKGRLFDARDNESGPRVAIVNEAFVKRYFPKEDPIGQRLLVEELVSGQRKLGPAIAWEIAGVTADVKFAGLNSTGVPVIYVPMMQCPWPGAVLSLRTSIEPGAVVQAARAAMTELDRDMPLTGVRTMEEVVSQSMTQSRTRTWLIGVFAAVALGLAALGIYGVMSYSVTRSTRDMGIRMALGASGGSILRLVLRKSMLLTGIGLAVGVGGALALSRVLSSMLFEVKATDPWTYAGVSFVLAFVALLAGFIPARRATRIDPVVALRLE